MKLQPATVDVLLSTLDQQAPVTAKPLGRLSSLVNAVIKRYMNPRAADGTVTHVRVEKRDGFAALPNALVDTSGTSLGTISGEPQVVFGGGDALRQVAQGRLYTKSDRWVRAQDPTGAAAIVFPQTVRSASVYAANSQAEAPDIAIVGSVMCLVWREVAQQDTGNGDRSSPTSSTLDGVRVMFRDVDGTTLRPAFTVAASTYLKGRVVAYGGYFWVLTDFITAGSTVQIDVTVFDGNGTQVTSFSRPAVTNNKHWDVTAIPSQGCVIAEPNNGSGVKFTSMTYVAGPGLTVTTNTDTSIACSAGYPVAWLTDVSGTASQGHLVAASFSGSAGTLTPYRIVSGAANHTYPVLSGAIDITKSWISGITGYKGTFGTSLTCAYTLMDLGGFAEYANYGTPYVSGSSQQNVQASDNYPDQLNNTTVTCSVPFTGSSTTIQTRLALALASRAFALGIDWCAWAYYPARKWGPLAKVGATAATHMPNRPADPSNFQPCWYLIPLNSAQRIAGRLEYGLAAADYQVLTPGGGTTPAVNAVPGARNRCLTSVVMTSTEALIVPLGYRAEQNIPETALLTQNGTATTTGPSSATFGWSQDTTVYTSSDTVGIKVFALGPDCGQAFSVNQATYLPGLMANVVEPGEVNVSEHGIIAPECPWIITSALTETLAGTGEFFWRAVGEYVTTRGKVYRSLPSAAFAYTTLEAQGAYVCGHNLSPTNKDFVRYALYRTAYTTATVQGSGQITDPPTIDATSTVNAFTSIAYKITNDLAPLYNAPSAKYIAGAATPFAAAFKDALTSPTMADGEVLYTDQGFLPRFPCPSFRGGCVWQNRAWVIGYDNALWFSGEIAEGEGEWFNPGFRVVIPTTDEVTAIAPMEGFLLVFTAGSVWYIPAGAPLPDATGANGAIPSPLRLPFEMGCTGFTAVVRQGCLYSSSAGGVWVITRALDNEWIGQSAQDALAPEITDMVIAGNYVVAATKTGAPMHLVAYDTNLGAWSTWDIQADNDISVVRIGAEGGQLVWADDGRVFQQTPDTYLDVDANAGGSTSYVPMSATISPVHIGGVRSWKRTWALQLQGDVHDVCALSVGLSYGDSGSVDVTYPARQMAVGELELEVRPTKQLAASVGLTISDAQGDTLGTGQGFALEVVSFYVGLEKGLKKLGTGSRIG